MAKKSNSLLTNTKFLAGFLVLGLTVSIGAVMFGVSDAGVINVSAVIANSNAGAKERGEETIPTPSKKTNADLPNGGLIGKGKSTAPPPAEIEAVATTSGDTEAADDGASGGEETSGSETEAETTAEGEG